MEVVLTSMKLLAKLNDGATLVGFGPEALGHVVFGFANPGGPFANACGVNASCADKLHSGDCDAESWSQHGLCPRAMGQGGVYLRGGSAHVGGVPECECGRARRVLGWD